MSEIRNTLESKEVRTFSPIFKQVRIQDSMRGGGLPSVFSVI